MTAHRLGAARGGRWPVTRVAGGLLQLSAVVVVAMGNTTLATVLVAGAMVLAGRAVRLSRTLRRDRIVTTARHALAAALVLTVIAVLAREVGHEPFRTDIEHGFPLALAIVGLTALAWMVAPVADEPEPGAEEAALVATLARSRHSDLMAPFTTGHRKRYAFSPDGRAAIGYRVVYGVSVAGPGPIGAPDAHAAALHAWLDRCDERGWRPAMIGAASDVRTLARPLGLRGVCIGDEVIAEVGPFHLDTPRMRGVRQAVQRTRNAGVEVTLSREGHLRRDELRALREVAHEWQRGHGERGFAMTHDHLLDHTHGEALVAVAWHHGRAVGFQRYFVCRGGTGLTLDVMPRRHDAPNGVNERLIVDTIEWARGQGITEVSLNFAAFRSLFEADPTPGRRALRQIVHLLDRFLDVESLYRFNAKFRPSWNPRHVLFRVPLDLPFVLAAALRLEFVGRGRLDRPADVALGATEQA